jgi:hypothetical protein
LKINNPKVANMDNQKERIIVIQGFAKDDIMNLYKTNNYIYYKFKQMKEYIKTKLNINTPSYSNKLLYNITSLVTDEKPNVLVDLTDNPDKITNLARDFMEVNCFVEQNLNLTNIYYHSDKEQFLSQIIYKIKEPCVIIMTNNKSTQTYLSKLSNRAFKDIIILENISNKSDLEFLSVYKKIKSVYPVINSDSIVIIPQN